jgi:hypothetical protein
MFSGGVDINVIKNEIDETSETGKVGGGVVRTEDDQMGAETGTDVEGADRRGNEQVLKKDSLAGGSISKVLVKTEDDDDEEEDEDDDSDENDDEEEDDDEDDDDDGNDNEMNGKRRKKLPCNSSQTKLGGNKKFKEEVNDKPEGV